jgi:TolA-binding protein
MSSNNINMSKNSKNGITREELDHLLNDGADSTSNFEDSEFNSFEKDAIDGWKSSGLNSSAMASLDKKFKPKYLNWGQAAIVGAIVTTFIALIIFIPSKEINNKNSNNEKITTLLNDQEITIEETDIVLPLQIEEMIETPIKEQITSQKIKIEFKAMQTPEFVDVIEILPLPIVTIDNQHAKKEIVGARKLGKEIYLQEFKLLDYRKYRSKPTIKTKQLVLTGTPASQEGEINNETETDWKDYYVPYHDYLDKTMNVFSKGQYKRALVRFEVILSSYKDDVNAQFYGGLCLFNLGEYDKAISYFTSLTQSAYNNFDEEAQWMTALSYEKTGQKNKANKILLQIVEQKGYYEKQARLKL